MDGTRLYRADEEPLTFPSIPGESARDWLEAPAQPQNVYPTSGQNRRRNEWQPTNARNQRKWSRTGR
jgi:hypothetical protein